MSLTSALNPGGKGVLKASFAGKVGCVAGFDYVITFTGQLSWMLCLPIRFVYV